MSEPRRFESFEDFWPFYVGEHANKLNRMLHFAGSTCSLGWLATAILKKNPAYLLAALANGYGFAWIGHFIVEKNRPATFTYPLWSFRGDWRMYAKILTGTMDAEVERCLAIEAERTGKTTSEAPSVAVNEARDQMN